MKNYKTFFFFTLLIITSCKEKAIEDKDKKSSWEEVSIETNVSKTIIYNETDSVYYRSWDYKKVPKDNKIYYEPINVKVKNFKITQQTKDSIYNLSYKIITEPVFVNSNVSDSQSSVMICISEKNTRICIDYFSVGTKISDDTQKLGDILKRIKK
ncbi:MAG: hypothetical protein V4548_09295 [Bacteroidota bacterium]